MLGPLHSLRSPVGAALVASAAVSGVLLGAAADRAVRAAPRGEGEQAATAHGSGSSAPTGGASASASAAASASAPPAACSRRFEAPFDWTAFQRGNVHTHTNWSDGDSKPEDVIRWYLKHGYHFLALTDHNVLTTPALFSWLERRGIVLVPGEEITITVHGKPVHVNGLCTRKTIGERHPRFGSKAEALRWAVGQVKAQGGASVVNHPNFEWSFERDDVLAAPQAELLEIASGHPGVNTEGDATHPSHEALWDRALRAGLRFAPAAVDDAHHLRPRDQRGPPASPGRAWIWVATAEGKRAAVCDALRERRLYASTGPELARLWATEASVGVKVKRAATVEFWGAKAGAGVDGVTERLASVEVPAAGEATYALRGDEAYVRAKVLEAGGGTAWSPASFTGCR
jgi:hypothetical protein